jgi:hypothetical protein
LSLSVEINGENRTSSILADGRIAISKTYGEPWTCDLTGFSLDGEIQTITADGVEQQWELDRVPSFPPSVEVDGVPVEVGVYGVDTGKDFYWEIGTKNLYQETTDPVLLDGTVLDVDLGTWYPESGQRLIILQTQNASFRIIGDGVSTTFALPRVPYQVLSVVYGSILPQTFGIYGEDTGKQWYIDLATGDIIQEVGDPPLPEDETLDIGYQYIVTVFGGVIRSVEREKVWSESPFLRCGVTATDYNHILERRAAGNWELTGTTDNAIAQKLMDEVLTAEGLTLQTGDAVAIASFKTENDTAADTLSTAGNLTGKRVWVDPEKTLYLVSPTASTAPFQIPSGASNISRLRVTETDEDYANVIILKSSQTITGERTEEFTGDDETTSFNVAHPLASAPQVTVNGVTNTVGIASVDTGRDWYWSQGSTEIRQDADGVPFK